MNVSPCSEDDERQIRERLNSAAKSRVHAYPPETLRQLLRDGRTLLQILDFEREPLAPERSQSANQVAANLQVVVTAKTAELCKLRDAIERSLEELDAKDHGAAAATLRVALGERRS